MNKEYEMALSERTNNTYQPKNIGIESEGDPIIQRPWTKAFRDMVWLIKALLNDLDLSKRFRVVVDYDPESEKVNFRTYYQNGESQEVQAEGLKNRIR